MYTKKTTQKRQLTSLSSKIGFAYAISKSLFFCLPLASFKKGLVKCMTLTISFSEFGILEMKDILKILSKCRQSFPWYIARFHSA